MMLQPTAFSEPISIFNTPARLPEQQKTFGQKPSGEPTDPARAGGREWDCPRRGCNLPQGHQVPLQGRAPLPHRCLSPRGFFPSWCRSLWYPYSPLEKGEPPLQHGMSSASCSPVKRKELALPRAVSQLSTWAGRLKYMVFDIRNGL